MALAVAEVHVLSNVQDLVSIDGPYLVDIRGAESVRAAAAMVALLDEKLGFIEEDVWDSDSKDKVDSKCVEGTGEEEYEFGSPSKDEEEGQEQQEDDDEGDSDGQGSGWIIPNLKFLHRVAHLADLLEELIGDVIPLLVVDLAETSTLHRLLVFSKDIHRIEKIVPGEAGKQAVKIGNKVQKLVSRAFNKRCKYGSEAGKLGEPRSRAKHGCWIADHRGDFLDQIKAVYERCLVSME